MSPEDKTSYVVEVDQRRPSAASTLVAPKHDMQRCRASVDRERRRSTLLTVC